MEGRILARRIAQGQLIRDWFSRVAIVLARLHRNWTALFRPCSPQPSAQVVIRCGTHSSVTAPERSLAEGFPLPLYERVIRAGAARDARLLHGCFVDRTLTWALLGIPPPLPDSSVFVQHFAGQQPVSTPRAARIPRPCEHFITAS
jgi:hypothetical protein